VISLWGYGYQCMLCKLYVILPLRFRYIAVTSMCATHFGAAVSLGEQSEPVPAIPRASVAEATMARQEGVSDDVDTRVVGEKWQSPFRPGPARPSSSGGSEGGSSGGKMTLVYRKT
jgi:hypothetical protein